MADSPAELQIEIETLERKHAANPEGRYFVPLANAYRKAGAVDHAEALLREGLRRHPDYLSAHIVLGRCMADRGETQEAMEEFRYVLSLDPQNLIALRTLGELALGAGRTEEAQRWYGELLAVDPMNEDARRALESLQASAQPPEDEEFHAGADWWQPLAEPAEQPAPAAPAPVEFEDTPVPPAPAAGAGDMYGRFVELDEDPPAADPGAPEEGAVEVVTETIAELYARQGFLDRSIGVYRELIRRRGGDPTLERRLAELEQQTAGEHAPAPAAEPDSLAEEMQEPQLPAAWHEEPETATEPQAEAADDLPRMQPAAEHPAEEDPFADSFGWGFQLPEEAPAEERSPEESQADEPAWAGVVDAVVDAAAEMVTEVVAEVVTPKVAEEPDTEEPDAAVAESPAETEEAPETPELSTPQPAAGPSIAEYLAELIAWRPVSAAAPVEPADAAAVERLIDEPAGLADGVASPRDGMVPAEEEPFPWEIPAELGEEPAAADSPAPSSMPEVEPVESFSFDAFLDEEPPAAEPTAPPAAPAAEPAVSQEADEGGEGDEDDLESFQAWLRSLKR